MDRSRSAAEYIVPGHGAGLHVGAADCLEEAGLADQNRCSFGFLAWYVYFDYNQTKFHIYNVKKKNLPSIKK